MGRVENLHVMASMVNNKKKKTAKKKPILRDFFSEVTDHHINTHEKNQLDRIIRNGCRRIFDIQKILNSMQVQKTKFLLQQFLMIRSREFFS